MKKRILLLATVAALMAVMLVAMASAALAVPPSSGETGCVGGQINAHHAIGSGTSSQAQAPYRGNPGEAHGGTGPDAAFTTAEGNTGNTDNCRH
jgi:opacity protein-like surface antigen